MRTPSWLLGLAVVLCSTWGYVRLDVLEEDLEDLLEDPAASAGRTTVAGYQRVLEVEEDRYRIEVGDRPVVVLGRLESTRPGDVVSTRVRILADGTLEALEIQEHPGRRTKIRVSALAALGLAALTAAWVRLDRTRRRLTIAGGEGA